MPLSGGEGVKLSNSSEVITIVVIKVTRVRVILIIRIIAVAIIIQMFGVAGCLRHTIRFRAW